MTKSRLLKRLDRTIRLLPIPTSLYRQENKQRKKRDVVRVRVLKDHHGGKPQPGFINHADQDNEDFFV